MPKIAEQTTAQHMPHKGAFMVFPPNSVSNSQPGFSRALANFQLRLEVARATIRIEHPDRRRGATQLHWEMSE